MGVADLTVGYPVHAVAKYRNWRNQHDAMFMDWVAACGVTGTVSGHSTFGTASSARKRELCRKCWPEGYFTFHPAPQKY